MNLSKLKFLWNAWTVLDKIQGDVKNMNAKSILKSKTFWLNVIAAIIQLGLPEYIPQPWGMLTLAGLNIGNRLLTNQPVKISITD